MKIMRSLLFFGILISSPIFARECGLPTQWQGLCRILNSRVAQKPLKMKLQEADALNLEQFLKTSCEVFPQLSTLQSILPKTTLELLMAIHNRGLSVDEAELMAQYLEKIALAFQFQNVGAFDENTSHIIGREWQQIDYTGEGMTWQKQKAHYARYGIEHFKSLSCLEKFFPVESKMPYFRKSYHPKYPNALLLE